MCAAWSSPRATHQLSDRPYCIDLPCRPPPGDGEPRPGHRPPRANQPRHETRTVCGHQAPQPGHYEKCRVQQPTPSPSPTPSPPPKQTTARTGHPATSPPATQPTTPQHQAPPRIKPATGRGIARFLRSDFLERSESVPSEARARSKGGPCDPPARAPRNRDTETQRIRDNRTQATEHRQQSTKAPTHPRTQS